jgi:acylglycerol lipase
MHISRLPRNKLSGRLAAALCIVASTACTATPVRFAGPPLQPSMLTDTEIVTADGYALPLHRWMPAGPPDAVVLGLHGFNDYGAGLNALAEALTPDGIAVYAYDQRGFGATAHPNAWHGQDALVADAIDVAHLLRARYPDTPLFLVGKSMGGAIALLAMTSDRPPPIDGTVLIAPAVAGMDAMRWYQRVGLWLGSLVAPGMELPVQLAQAMGVRPTDQPWVIDALRADPLVRHSASIEMLDHLAELMGAALEAAARFDGHTLILYGARDDIIHPMSICAMLDRLPDQDGPLTSVIIYPRGFHLLTRYSRRIHTFADIAEWLTAPGAPLTSNRLRSAAQARATLCD